MLSIIPQLGTPQKLVVLDSRNTRTEQAIHLLSCPPQTLRSALCAEMVSRGPTAGNIPATEYNAWWTLFLNKVEIHSGTVDAG